MIDNITKSLFNKIDFNNINTKDLSKEVKIKSYNEEIVELFNKLKEEVRQAEFIAIKIVKGETLTPKEDDFISKKYPDLKETAEESLNEYKSLKQIVKNCKSEEDIQQLISKVIKKVEVMIKNGSLTENQGKIKLSVAEELKKFSITIKHELKKVELTTIKYIKGKALTSEEEELITQKYPDAKKLATKLVKEYENLKFEIRKCENSEDVQKIIKKEIYSIDDKAEKGLISRNVAKLKMVALEEVVKYSEQIEKDDKNKIAKIQAIVKKIFKGEKLTLKEQVFINEKCPESKEIIEKYIKESKEFHEIIKKIKSNEEKQKIFFKEINNIKEQAKNGQISQMQVEIKLAALKEIEEREIKNKGEVDLKFNLNPFMHIKLDNISNNTMKLVMIISIISFIMTKIL